MCVLNESCRTSAVAVGYAAISTAVSNIFTVIARFFCHRTLWWCRNLVRWCERLSRRRVYSDCTWTTDTEVGSIRWRASWIGGIGLTASATEQRINVSYSWPESLSGFCEADLSRVRWHCVRTSLWDSFLWGLQGIFQTYCTGSVFICMSFCCNRLIEVAFWLPVLVCLQTK